MNKIPDFSHTISEVLTQEMEKFLSESRRDLDMRLLQIEDMKWTRLYGDIDTEEGFSLDSLKDVSNDLYDMVATSPLIRRGVQLRHGYTFGKGFTVNVPPEAKIVRNVLDNRYNRDALLSENATEALLTEDAACGNAFHIKVGKGANTRIIAVPLSQVTGIITDEHDAQSIQYFKRTWTANGKTNDVWIPLNRYVQSLSKGTKLPSKISNGTGDKEYPVAQDTVGFHYAGLRPAGWTLGIPTALAAKAWLLMYTESLQNNALLVKMLSQFAWKIVNKTAAGASSAGAVVASERGVGGTASMTENQDIQAVPRGNDVNFNNIQPLAALVASTFGVSVIALLSSPGATGGSYGAATTLDEPTFNVMSVLRSKLKDYIEEILESIVPSVDVTLSFPSLTTDADYRKVQSLSVAHQTGALHQAEYRDAVLEVYPVPNAKKTMPKGDGFNSWSDPKAEKAQASSDPIARQGNSGAVPGGVDQGETNHDNDGDR